MKINFTKGVRKDVERLDPKIRSRIKKKLLWLANQPDPLKFAIPIRDFESGQYRFRIGDYRVIFDVIDGCMEINSIGHRREIYR